MKQKSDTRNTLSSCWSFLFELKRFNWAYSEVCLLSLCTSFLPRDNQILVYSEKFVYTVVKKRQMSNIELRSIFCFFTPSDQCSTFTTWTQQSREVERFWLRWVWGPGFLVQCPEPQWRGKENKGGEFEGWVQTNLMFIKLDNF